MSTILDEIAAATRLRVAREKAALPLESLRERAGGGGDGGARFLEALRGEELSFICEVKKASPSKGIISPDFPYLSIAKAYEGAGADAVSCLTEPKWFLGSDEIFGEIRSAISLPMLRKDFVVDEYQLWQAKCLGADCVLLICALLDDNMLARCLALCENLGLAALVETHDETEIARAAAVGALIIGVNNRNLKDFSVDLETTARLRDQIPPGTLMVAESGVRGPADAAALRRTGADALLVGEALMRASDKKAFLESLRNARTS